ncbi:MAG: TRAP transporter large permease [Candidatus Aminicenantaceae bacterium]
MVILFLSILVLLLLGMPIAFALGLGSCFSLLSDPTLPLVLVPQRMFTALDSWPIMAIPLFMLAGGLMDKGGISRRIVEFSSACFGFIKGSLAMVSVMASMIFAGISGSSTADTAAVGSIMMPAMRKKGYDMDFATALIAAAGAIGPIIPPSILMILIGYITDTSVAGLFLGGIVPGTAIGIALMGVSFLHSRKRGKAYLPTSKFQIRDVMKTGKKALPGLGMPFIILFGILGGVFTATEAAAVAAVYGLLIGVFVYKEITFKDLPKIFLKSAETSCIIMFIASTAFLFAWLITVKQLPAHLGAFLKDHIGNEMMFLVLLNLVLLVIGMFMESFSAIIVFMPILFPVAQSYGVDPIHFGIIATVNLAIGYITPPYGATLFVSCGISGRNIRGVTPRIIPIMAAMIVVLLIVTYFPETFMWIPQMAAK